MEDEVIETNVEEPKLDNTDTSDLTIQNKALQDLLKENQETMKALKEELTQVKTANAKLVAQLDISKNQQSVDDIINSNFNRYFKNNK